MTTMVKGFGCRQAYESLSCRNPRSAFRELWGFVYRIFRRAAARSVACRSQRVKIGVFGCDGREFRGDWESVWPVGSQRHSDWRRPSRWPALF